MRVLHLSDPIGAVGGRESYIESFSLRSTEAGWRNRTVGIAPGASLESVRSQAWSEGQPPDLVFIHSPELWPVASELAGSAPCIGWAHAYTSVCPGGMSWYPATGERCSLTVGSRCAVNAYLKRCAPRRPDRLLQVLRSSVQAQRAEEHLQAVFVGSSFMLSRLKDAGIPAGKLSSVPYFQRWSSLDLRSQDDSADSDAKCAPTTPPIVLCPSRLHEAKGIDTLIRAMAHVTTPCELVIVGVGSPSYVDNLHAESRRVGRPGLTIRFILEHGQGLSELYRAATVVAVPSLWPEPFGLVGPEAMAFGVPIVAFDVGGVREWLIDGDVGLLARPGDEADLGAKISSLLAEPDKAARMGRAGRDLAESRFSWNAHFERLQVAVAAHGVDLGRS